jgi:hypothetical protein
VGFPPQPARPPCCLYRNEGIRGQGKAVGTNADGFAILVRLLSQRPNARTPLPAALVCRSFAQARDDDTCCLMGTRRIERIEYRHNLLAIFWWEVRLP